MNKLAIAIVFAVSSVATSFGPLKRLLDNVQEQGLPPFLRWWPGLPVGFAGLALCFWGLWLIEQRRQKSTLR